MLLSNELVFLTAEKSALANAKGGFARKVAVLSQSNPQPLDFLSKILAAAQLNLETDTLFAEIPSGETRTLAPDLQEYRPQYILVFGLSPAQLGLSFEVQAYQILNFYGCTWLFADPLSTLEPDKVKKGQLWTALKQIFL